MSSRRAVREAILKAIYAEELGKNSVQDINKQLLKEETGDFPEEHKFAERAFYLTVENKAEYDELISKHINNWEVDRLAVIDKLILRMAVNELLNFEEIPVKVTINEAIELAKSYSTRKSGNFVNGILDAINGDLKKNNKINKTGRGLLETSGKE